MASSHWPWAENRFLAPAVAHEQDLDGLYQTHKVRQQGGCRPQRRPRKGHEGGWGPLINPTGIRSVYAPNFYPPSRRSIQTGDCPQSQSRCSESSTDGTGETASTHEHTTRTRNPSSAVIAQHGMPTHALSSQQPSVSFLQVDASSECFKLARKKRKEKKRFF